MHFLTGLCIVSTYCSFARKGTMPGWTSTAEMPWKPSSGQNITDAATRTHCVLRLLTLAEFPLSGKK